MKTQESVNKRKLRGTHLEGTNGGALETQICLEVLGDFSDQALERQLADQQLSRLLVSPDLSEGDCTGPITRQQQNQFYL